VVTSLRCNGRRDWRWACGFLRIRRYFQAMPTIRLAHLLSAITVFPMLVAAQPGSDIQSRVGSMPSMPVTQATRCVTSAASYHRVNPWILKAILKVESGFRSNVINRNRNGTLDVGMAQINSIHFRELARYGIAPSDLMDACVATYVAAWHLAKQLRAHGNTWFAVGAYHSTTPCFNRRYAGLVWNTMLRWGAVEGPRLNVPSLAECGHAATNTRTSQSARTGAQHPASTSRTTMLAFDATP